MANTKNKTTGAKSTKKTSGAKTKSTSGAPKTTVHTGNATAQAVESIQLADLFKQLGGWVKTHPKSAIGTGLNAAGNVAGLVDNDKLLGQAAGLAIGAFAPGILGKALGKKILLSPLMRANIAMGGGQLGALFDSLRAKQEEEQEMARRYGGKY